MAICGTKSRRRAADDDERITMEMEIMDGDLSKTTIKMTKIMRRRPSSSAKWRICHFPRFSMPSYRPHYYLFLFLLISSQIVHLLATSNPQRPSHHRRRQIAELAHQQGKGSGSNILFRYQCPQGCRCVPDPSSIELMIVSCQWNLLGPNSFDDFPKNGTKSLAIQCTKMPNSTEREENPLTKAGTFQGFDELRELKIVGCQTDYLAGDLFLNSVPHLRSLSLTKMPSLQRIEPNFFAPLAKLEMLNLSENGLRELPGDGICHLQQLQVLNLSGNSLQSARLGIFMPRPADQPCQFNQLIILDISANSIHILAEQDLRPFPVLAQLNFASNGMVEIQPDAFRSGPVPLLQHLDISSNRLSDVPSIPEGLIHLDAASNQFRQIPDSISQLAGLTRLNLSGNEIGQTKIILQSSAIEQLDLSWNLFEQMPFEILTESANSLKILKLAGNKIDRIEAGSLQNLTSLQELDISSSRLSNLEFNAFEGLSNLALLNLANNSIGKIDAEAFQPLASNLHTLIMNQNELTELPMAVGRLTRVRRMDLSGNKISKAYKFVLNKLPHLARLDLSQNSLESVESFVFMECDHLQELSLRANRIQTISPDAFEKCPKLKRIDLAQNQLTNLGPSLTLLKTLRTVNLTGNALEELNWTKFPPELLEISANWNRIERIGTLEDGLDDGEEGIGARKLRKLELKGNRIGRLSADSLPLGLEELDVSENELATLANNTFHGMGQLKSVNLRSNRLRTIPRELYEVAIEANAPFGRMWIAGNSLECNCEMGWLLNASIPWRVANSTTTTGGGGGVQDILEVDCLTPLNGKRKAIIETEVTDFLCPYTQFCEAGCVCCFFRDCDCKSKCPKGCECFRDLHSITNVVKCKGRIGGGENDGSSNDQLELLPMMASHILLSDLNLPLLRENVFAGRDRLIELHINSSKVKKIQPKAFNTLINLKSLHLANNQLEQINGDEGFSIQNIRRLNLANNRIRNKNVNLLEMIPRLEELHLEGNSLEELPIYLRNASGDQLRKITLAGNPFRCDCYPNGRFDIPHWLARNRWRVLDSEWLKCVENVTRAQKTNDTTVLSLRLPNEGDDLFTMLMLEFLSDENRTICVAQTNGIFGFGGPYDTLMFAFLMAILLLIIPILLMFAFRPQWFTNVKEKGRNQEEKNGLLLPTNNNSLSSTHSPTVNGGSPIPTELSSQHVLPNECDIFICYTKNDEKAIMEFCRSLEFNYGYILCYLHQCGYYREDPVYISNELIKLIGESRMLVVYLSREFMRLDWNRPQLTSSIKLDKKQNESRRILFIVGYDMDETDLANLPIEIGSIILRDGYLRRDSPQFWEDLKRLLRDIPPIRYPSPSSETSQSHIYSEYGQIPPAPSDFV